MPVPSLGADPCGRLPLRREGMDGMSADLPRYTADGDPVSPPPRCQHKFRIGECPRCDGLTPAPEDFRELVKSAREESSDARS